MNGGFRFSFHCVLPFACDSGNEEKTKRQAVTPVRCRLSPTRPRQSAALPCRIAQDAAQGRLCRVFRAFGPPPPIREGSERDAFWARCTRCTERRRQPIPVAFIVQTLSCVSFMGTIVPNRCALCHNFPPLAQMTCQLFLGGWHYNAYISLPASGSCSMNIVE